MRKEEEKDVVNCMVRMTMQEEGGGKNDKYNSAINCQILHSIHSTYLHEGKLGALKSIDERLPRGTGAERGTAQQNANVRLPLHVDGGIHGSLLGGVECSVTKEDAEGVAKAGGESKGGRIGGVSKMILGNDGRSLPAESCGEDLGDGHLGCDDKSLGETGRCGEGGRSVNGCLERIGLGMGRVVDLPLGRGRIGILFLRAVGRDDR